MTLQNAVEKALETKKRLLIRRPQFYKLYTLRISPNLEVPLRLFHDTFLIPDGLFLTGEDIIANDWFIMAEE